MSKLHWTSILPIVLATIAATVLFTENVLVSRVTASTPQSVYGSVYIQSPAGFFMQVCPTEEMNPQEQDSDILFLRGMLVSLPVGYSYQDTKKDVLVALAHSGPEGLIKGQWKLVFCSADLRREGAPAHG